MEVGCFSELMRRMSSANLGLEKFVCGKLRCSTLLHFSAIGVMM